MDFFFFFLVPFSCEQIIIQTCVRCHNTRLWFVLVADAEGHPGAGLRRGRGRGPAAGDGAGLHHQPGSLRNTAPLSGPGEERDERG